MEPAGQLLRRTEIVVRADPIHVFFGRPVVLTMDLAVGHFDIQTYARMGGGGSNCLRDKISRQSRVSRDLIDGDYSTVGESIVCESEHTTDHIWHIGG